MGAEKEASPDVRVAFPQGDALWIVRFEKGQTGTTALGAEIPPKLKEMEVIQQGGLRRDTLIWTDGQKSEHWWSVPDNYVFFQNRGDPAMRGIKASQLAEARYDQSLFYWADKQTYKGSQKLDDKDFWYFEESFSATNEEGETKNGIFKAWVDPKTAKPYAWSDGGRMVYFEFKTIQEGFRLQMPPVFAQEFAKYRAYRSPPQKLGKKQ